MKWLFGASGVLIIITNWDRPFISHGIYGVLLITGFFIMDKQDEILKALTGEEDWWDRLFHVNESPDEYITRKGLDKR
jgi:hypothetical protein